MRNRDHVGIRGFLILISPRNFQKRFLNSYFLLKLEKRISNQIYAIFVQVRIIASILVVYVMIMCLIPCEHSHGDIHSSHSSTEHNSDSGHEEDERCSPFCVCACVKGVELTEKIESQFSTFIEVSSIQIFSFSENLHSDFVPSFWQPPKL
jgi:hypothetical protein